MTGRAILDGQFDDADVDARSGDVAVPLPTNQTSSFHATSDEDYDDEYNEYELDDDDLGTFEYDDDNFNLLQHGQSSSTHGHNMTRMNLSHAVANTVNKMQDLEVHKRTLTQGRDDRATSEQVMDPRTRLILFKLLSRGFLEKIDGCLSTGKEANVYYAQGGRQHTTVTEFAIKIYKTSILVFKDRDKYVAGEHRWRRGYCKSNPRKMVKVWAEKEMRNYRRIHQAGIPCPTPVLLKSHILVMEFLGNEGWPSPRLKDANLSEKRHREAYVQCCLILRHLFQRCRLVHGDFSEYNTLWHDSQIYVIDVSQSVETDHPSALDFLRKDSATINEYFRKVGRLCVMTTRQLFEFVTIADDSDDEMEQLDRIMETVEKNSQQLATQSKTERLMTEQQEAVDEAVFMSSFLPRSLSQVAEYENVAEKDTYFAEAVASMTTTAATISSVQAPEELDDDHAATSSGDESSFADSDDHDSLSSSDNGYVKVPKTAEQLQEEREQKKAERKANKKLVKEERSEKRRTKVKKKDKKRTIKKSKAGNRKNK